MKSLRDRLAEAQEGAGGAAGLAAAAPLSPGIGAWPAAAAVRSQRAISPDLRVKIHQHLIRELGPMLYDGTVTDNELELRLRDAIREALRATETQADAVLFAQLVTEIRDDVIGYGPLEQYLADDSVSEIMVNGPDILFVERRGQVVEVPSGFVDANHLRRVIERIVSQIGRRVDESSPMVDARLPDGSRVHAVLPPLAIGGPFLTIRKFSRDPLRIDDLVTMGTLDPRSSAFLQACIQGRRNIIVSGGTGTGKTTLLNVLSGFIPQGERVVTVEDAKELQLVQRHVLALEARPANVEGTGEISIRDLVRTSLRMRPDRIVVGECRGGETLDMLQAMNTGHDGSMTTVHANSPRDAIARVETLTLLAGFDLPVRAIREQVASAIDLVIQISRLRDGSRRVTHITEVAGIEGDSVRMRDLFLFDFHAGVDEHGRPNGCLEPTGKRPTFAHELADMGIEVPVEIYGTPPARELPVSSAS